MREAWTDERLDDLSQRVSQGFSDVRAEISDVRSEVRSLRADMNERLSEANERIDSLNRTLLQCFLGLTTLMVTGFIGIALQSAGS